MPKDIKIGLIIVGLVVAAFGVLMVVLNIHEGQTRHLLAQELTNLPVPEGCHEKNRQYTGNSLDTASSWDVEYNCSATGGAAYSTIVGQLKQQGFTAQRDYSIPTPDSRSIFYSFNYVNPQFEVDYNFLPNLETNSVDANKPADLQKLPITGYGVTIYRR